MKNKKNKKSFQEAYTSQPYEYFHERTYKHSALLVPVLLFILIVLVWFSLGFTFDYLLGVNDIVMHHLVGLRGARQSFPFFQPLYDWLWMGGGLVAGVDGNIFLERLLSLIGLPIEHCISLTTMIIQWGMGYFALDLISEKSHLNKNHHVIDKLLIGLLFSFLPVATLRIVYGHLLFVLSAYLVIFIYWLIQKEKFHIWQLLIGLFLACNAFATSIHQETLYLTIFLLPMLLISFKWKKFSVLIPFFAFCFFINFDYVLATLQMFLGGDACRNMNSSSLIYSYAHLTWKEIPDFIFYKIINWGNLNFYVLHETKLMMGIISLALLIPLIRQRKILLGAFIFFIGLFIFAPAPFDTFFNQIPGLSMFRIPQRSLILFIPIMTIQFFISFYSADLQNKNNFKIDVALLGALSLLLIFQEIIIFDILLVIFLIVLLLPEKLYKYYRPSLKVFSLTLLCAHILFLDQFPDKFTLIEPLRKVQLSSVKDEDSLKRLQIQGSREFDINTNRMMNNSSLFGYTHVIASYKNIYQGIFSGGSGDDGQVYFPPIRKNYALDNLLNLYRYGESPLSYVPASVSYLPDSERSKFYLSMVEESPNLFKNKIKEKAFVFEKGEEKRPEQSGDCPSSLTVNREAYSSETGRLSLDVKNTSANDCLLIIPFNYSKFIKVLGEGLNEKLVNVNSSQMGLWVKPGNHQYELGTRDGLFYGVKLLGFLLAFLVLFFVSKTKEFKSRKI